MHLGEYNIHKQKHKAMFNISLGN